MIRFVPETGSTNADLAARLSARDYVPEGEWLVADRQGAGRGRQGRVWIDGGAGNFMGSTLVHLRPGDPVPSTLALVAGLALHGMLGTLGASAVLKWPNDILAGGAKLAGILIERHGDALVVGIGVNLAAAPELPDRAATSLAALGISAPRDAFAEALARQFDVELVRWRSFGLAPIVARWMAAAHPVGTLLRVDARGGDGLEGEFTGLTVDGALQLRLPNGTTEIVNAGEVLLAGD